MSDGHDPREILRDFAPWLNTDMVEQIAKLAYHAALPAALNAEFVHLLRINFVDGVTAEAETLLLLSPLCRTIGDDLFDMPPELRNILLHELVEKYGIERVRDVARFLGQYSHHGTPWGDNEALDKAQRLTALNFLEPVLVRTWMHNAEQTLSQGASLGRDWYVAMRGEIRKVGHNIVIEHSNPLRILVVDDEVDQRELHTELLHNWGFHPYIATGTGDFLIEDAKSKARKYRCHLALVDMRLRDGSNSRDFSGLELVPDLRPTESIIVSGHGDRKAAVDALRKYGALNFVGKEDDPNELFKAINGIAHEIGIDDHQVQIEWSYGASSQDIVNDLFDNSPDVPSDQVNTLINQLFKSAKRIVLTPISNEDQVFERLSAPRRQSRVFHVTVDNQGSMRIVKIARVDKIVREIANYNQYVQNQLHGDFRAEKVGEALLWDLGAVAYRQIGNTGSSMLGTPETLTSFYHAGRHADQIVEPLRHFFEPTNWGRWYLQSIPSQTSLFVAYDTIWKGRLSEQILLWRHHNSRRTYNWLAIELPNPTRWLADHYQDNTRFQEPRQAVTHGDLHADNLFVDDKYSWPIDFERTGPGPILRDFIELTQDLLTRVARFEPYDMPLFFDVAIALCRPMHPKEPLVATELIKSHPEALKVFTIVDQLQQLAHQRTQYTDRREYLWGLLLNSLFSYTLANEFPADSPRSTRTLLLASVICARLDHWRPNDPWPPLD